MIVFVFLELLLQFGSIQILCLRPVRQDYSLTFSHQLLFDSKIEFVEGGEGRGGEGRGSVPLQRHKVNPVNLENDFPRAAQDKEYVSAYKCITHSARFLITREPISVDSELGKRETDHTRVENHVPLV